MTSSLPSIWPPSNLVIFDCDSTLSAVEGIDELARLTSSEENMAVNIASLTKRAMEGEIPLESAVHQIKTETHRLVRRQYNWFSLSDERIKWLDIQDDFRDQARELVAEFLTH